MLKRAAENPNARQFDKDSLAAVREDKDYALAWIRAWGKGRLFYCALGHRAEVTLDPTMVKFYLAGIQYALGDLKADDRPSGAAKTSQAQPAEGKGPQDTEQAKTVFQHVRFDPAFELTTFAAPPPAALTLVFVSTAPGRHLVRLKRPNGSVGTTRGMGEIVGLRDTNGDGVADESLEFAKVDAPRGLVASGNTVFVLHPPHISAFIDKDGDGVADEQKVIVSDARMGLRGPACRPCFQRARAGNRRLALRRNRRFWFQKGRRERSGGTLQLRGGGVVRVRTDGTGLELYIVEAPATFWRRLSVRFWMDWRATIPTMAAVGTRVSITSADWRTTRFSQAFQKLSAEETVKPLADYGGGSGCGAAWVLQPGRPAAWNHRPITVDWRQTVHRSAFPFSQKAPPS